MSVEGMWAVYFGDVDGEQTNSGILVLETGRIFGGDSFMAYKGTYSVSSGQIKGAAEIWAFNPTIEVVSAFGEIGPEPSEVQLEGHIHQPDGSSLVIDGSIWQTKNPAAKLAARLIKISDLP